MRFQSESLVGTGAIWDISESGLRVDAPSAVPEQGAGIRVQLFVSAGSDEIPLSGVVVRLLKASGFAVRFHDLGPAERALLRRIGERGSGED